MSISTYLTKLFNYNEVEILKSKIKELENKIELIEKIHNKELEIKDKEISLLKNYSLEKKGNKTNLKNIKLSNTEKKVISLHSKYQCKDYEDLHKVTNKNKAHLRNIVSKLKKKGYTLEWYL